MNEWDQRIRDHRVWAEMNNLGPAIDAASAVDGLSPETAIDLERIRVVLTYCGKRLAAADPLITSPALLEEIAGKFSAINNELAAFVSDKNVAHVATANASLDASLTSITQLPGAYSAEELGALSSSVKAYREVVDKAIRSATKKMDEADARLQAGLTTINSRLDESSSKTTAATESLQTVLTQLSIAIQNEQAKVAQTASDQQGQFSVSQEARSKEFNDSMRASTQDLAKLVADYQGQFSTAQEVRSKEFSSSEVARQTKYTETLSEYTKKLADQDAEFTRQRNDSVASSIEMLTALRNQYEDKAGAILIKVVEHEQHVEKLVGVIGNLGVTSGYLRTANQAKYAMWMWQTLTVTALVTLSALAYKTLGLLESSDGAFNWGGFAGRVLLLTSLGVIAAYCGNQADKLFVDERRNRKVALELEAIGPFLAPLPTEDQNKFRIQIGDRSFGQEHDIAHPKHHKSPASLIDLLKSKESKDLLDVIIEVAKKAKDTAK